MNKSGFHRVRLTDASLLKKKRFKRLLCSVCTSKYELQLSTVLLQETQNTRVLVWKPIRGQIRFFVLSCRTECSNRAGVAAAATQLYIYWYYWRNEGVTEIALDTGRQTANPDLQTDRQIVYTRARKKALQRELEFDLETVG